MSMLKVRLAFSLMGEVLEAEPGCVAVDVGSKCIPGVIDHHFAGLSNECAASLIVQQPALVLEHLGPGPHAEVTVRMHREPDLDCVVAAYFVRELVRCGALPPGSEALARYTRDIDRGLPPPDGVGPSSLWGLYAAVTVLSRQRCQATARSAPSNTPDDEALYREWVTRGFELLDRALSRKAWRHPEIRFPDRLSGWEAEQSYLAEQAPIYQADLGRCFKRSIELPQPEGGTRTVEGLWIKDPNCGLFKHLARASGIVFMHVVYTRSSATSNTSRHVLSVTPEQGVWLKGLGAALEASEVKVRVQRGFVRDSERRYPDVTNNDPWYDGRSRLHGFTIVDTPRQGTLLEEQVISDIVWNPKRWISLGQGSGDRVCRRGCRVPAEDKAAFCPHHGHQLVPATIAGRYRAVRFIDEGGMGFLWEVEDIRTGQRYALKAIRRALVDKHRDTPGKQTSTVDLWSRFVSEARLAHRVGHRNVVKLVDFQADSTLGPFILSEYVKGVLFEDDLTSALEQHTHYPWRKLRHILIETCEALEAVHAAGVFHRDLKPSNILLANPSDDEPSVKVFDFGIAMLSDPDATRLTSPGIVGGTPEYAAPEQLCDRFIGPKMDLYPLGVMLYSALAGRLPFPEPDAAQNKVRSPAPPLTSAHPKATDPRVLSLISGLLERDPNRRWPDSPRALADALREIV